MIVAFGSQRPEIEKGAFVAPDAVLIGGVHLGKDASVWWKAVLRADGDRIRIGEETNIQDGAVLHADPGFPVLVGDRVSVGHGAILHGCRVGQGSLIGMGALVMNGAQVGEGAILGAGSLLPEGKKIPSGVLAFGRPAQVVRELTAQEMQDLTDRARRYRDLKELYIDIR